MDTVFGFFNKFFKWNYLYMLLSKFLELTNNNDINDFAYSNLVKNLNINDDIYIP